MFYVLPYNNHNVMPVRSHSHDFLKNEQEIRSAAAGLSPAGGEGNI